MLFAMFIKALGTLYNTLTDPLYEDRMELLERRRETALAWLKCETLQSWERTGHEKCLKRTEKRIERIQRKLGITA